MKQLINKKLLAGSLLGLGVVSGASAQVTAVIPVTATALSFCSVVALPLAFGNYAAGTSLQGSTTLTVACTPGTSYSIGLDAGTGPSASESSRKLASLTNGVLNYSLTKDAGLSQNWGNSGGDAKSDVGTGLPQIHTVYASIPAGQFSDPGLYSDVVTVTVNY